MARSQVHTTFCVKHNLCLRVAFDFDLTQINISTHNIGNKDIQTSEGCATSTCNRNSRTGKFGNMRSYKLNLSRRTFL